MLLLSFFFYLLVAVSHNPLYKFSVCFLIVNCWYSLFLGDRPLHLCWAFWDTSPLRPQAQRLQQEDTTCRLLLTLLRYGTCPDSADQRGETALHLACRRGPTRAVKILLSFKADLLLRNHKGEGFSVWCGCGAV